jgi:transposase
LFVLHTGVGWEGRPQKLGFGCGMTCWRRLQRWTDAGVFDQVHQPLVASLNAANRIDWSRAAMDGSDWSRSLCSIVSIICAKVSKCAEPHRRGSNNLIKACNTVPI